jgi:hypothetical protein
MKILAVRGICDAGLARAEVGNSGIFRAREDGEGAVSPGSCHAHQLALLRALHESRSKEAAQVVWRHRELGKNFATFSFPVAAIVPGRKDIHHPEWSNTP